MVVRAFDLDPGSGGGTPPDPGDSYPAPEGGSPPEEEAPPEQPLPEGGDPPEQEPYDPEPQAPEGGDPLPEETPTWTEVVIEEWVTARDARVCPICGPLDGQQWPRGEGPYPPAHMGCRCARVYAYTNRIMRRGRPEDTWEIDRPADRQPSGPPDQGGGIRRF